MMINTEELGTWLIIMIMTIVTIVTRWGGIFIMSYIPINHRVQQFISAMSGAVLIAILAPMLITSDLGGKLALLVTALGTLLLNKPLLAILFGMALAATVRII